LQSVSDIGPLCRLQVVLRIVENLPPKVSQLGLRFAIVVEGFKVYDYRAIVAVQFLADGHVGEQVLVVCDVGHYIAGDDAGPFPAWRAHLVGRDAEYHCGGVNEMMDECWGHGLNNFRDWHPIVDFTGKPSVILGVPLTSVHITPSNDLQSFHIGN